MFSLERPWQSSNCGGYVNKIIGGVGGGGCGGDVPQKFVVGGGVGLVVVVVGSGFKDG